LQPFRFSHRLLFLSALLFGLLPTLSVFAQDDDQLEPPVYLTARLFEVRVPSKQDPLTNQVFRVRTAAQTDDEKWLSTIKKAYPLVTEAALLRTAQFRLFRRPRPGIIVIGDSKLAHLEVQFLVAQGLRDDDTINTMALSEINMYAGPKSTHPIPMSMMSHGFEVEAGLTYFYTDDGVRLKSSVYSTYFRDGSPVQAFENSDVYLVLAISCEETKPVPLTFDEAKSAALQAKATKKPDPNWPEVVKKQGMVGKVSVRAEVNAEGKVATAMIWQSSLPEGNQAAREAVKQWEFPPSEFAGINAPASALFTFTIAPTEKKTVMTPTEPPTSGAVTKTATPPKTVATKPAVKKPPVKRLNK